MANTYSSNLRLIIQTTGENAGTWGTYTNTNIATLLEQAITGVGAIAVSGSSNYTLTVTDGASDESRNAILNVTGTLTAAINIICPTVSKTYIIKNGTTGGYAVTLKTSGGTGISVPNGSTMFLYCDGTNVVEAVNYQTTGKFSSITDTGLTSGRVTYAGTGGLLQDSANLTFNGTTLTAAGLSGPFNGTVGATSPSTGAFTTLSASGQLTLTNASDYNLYASGAGANYMAGKLGIGATAATARSLAVALNMTGSTTARGVTSIGQIQSDVTGLASYFATSANTVSASFTLPDLRHYTAIQGTFGAGSTVTAQLGFVAENSLTGATNNYGFYGDIASGTGRWNLYMNGTASNYFAGKLLIGGTSTNSTIYNALPLTGGSSYFYSFNNVAQINSDTTSEASSFQSYLNTQAATFTLASLRHFKAYQGTIGAGSTITNQTGYFVDPALTGATNNYGFVGNIASGTGRYNLYMGGTADNYMAGSLGIGSAPTSSTKFVSGGTAPASGGYSYLVRSTASIDPTATTTAAYIFSSEPSILTGTLPSLYHYMATQATFTGSTASQYGFIANSTLTGATNNYGFYSNIASGTGRWCLYMTGTASNYMAGKLLIGTTSSYSTETLQVYGDYTVLRNASFQALIGSGTLVTGASANDFAIRSLYATVFSTGGASERMRIDTSGNLQMSGGTLVMPGQGAQTSKGAAATLTGAELITGILQYTGAAAVITMPLGSTIESALSWAANDVSMDWFVINTGSGTCTIAANGNTTVGTLTVAAGASGHFRIRRTATNTFTIYRLS